VPTAKNNAPARQRGGRSGVHLYTPQIEEQILARLALGETLNAICHSPGMPTIQAVKLWVLEDRPAGIASRYARARQLGYEVMADQVIELSDDRSFMGRDDANAIVQAQRLSVDSRKWLLSKVLPKIYGDKIEVSGDPDAPVVHRIELVPVAPRLSAGKVIEHDDDTK
jgi:hypothetical protein